jgi:hypothetical protein
MTEYLPEQKSESRSLRGNEYLDVKFKVKNPGPITVLAYADWWREWDTESRSWLTNPTKRKVELFKPGVNTPIATRTEEGWGQTTSLGYNVPASEVGPAEDWTARVTNLERRTELFRLIVSYPGDIPIKTYTIDASSVEAFFSSIIGQIKIRVTRGMDASYIDFPETFGVEDVHFTVKDFVFDPWWFPTIKEYPNDINSSGITFSLENATSGYSNGLMRLVVQFEEHGREILGTWHGHMSNIRLTIDLGLSVQNGKISYYNVGVSLSFNLDMLGIPDWLADPIFGYKGDIQRTVKEKIRTVFQKEAMRQAFSDAITKKVSPFLGSNPQILSVKIRDDQLTIRYYNA